MRILNRYFWKESILSILLIMFALLAMFSFFDLIQELENLGRGKYGINNMLVFVLLSIPGHIYDVAPVAVLLGMMFSLSTLSSHSELVVMRVSGLSLYQIGFILLKVALLFTVLTFFVGELITPISEKMAQRMRIKATNSVVAQDFKSGLWVKDGKSFVNASTVLPNATLLNIHIYEFDDAFRLRSINNAERGVFKDEKWNLKGVTQTVFGYHDDVSKNTVQTLFFNDAKWNSLVRPEILNVLFVQPEKMSTWNLFSFIDHLKANNQKTTRYEMALWEKIIYPLACLVMVILALPFGFTQQRAGGTSTKVLIGLMIGVVYQILNRVFVHLGVLNDWPPFLSAAGPTILFLLIGIGMVRWIEQR